MREMKDSGIEWIGIIPNSWNVVRNKPFFVCSKEILGSNSACSQLLSLTTKGIKKKRPEDSTGKVPESYDTYQIVCKDDLVLCLFDLDVSAVFSGISPFDGMISPAYKVLKCKESIFSKYADYWFSYVFDGRKFMHYSKNLRYTLSYDEFAVLPFLMPARDEQQRIADYLDRKCAEIDAVIADTQKTIDEYKTLKQSIITEAVTKGIRGNRPMKDSGIEWFPVIPKDWSVSRVGLHFDIILGKMLCNNQLSADYTLEPYYCAADVHFSGISTYGLKTMWFSPVEKDQYRVSVGDLLVVEGGAGAGGCAIVNQIDFDAYIQNSVMIVRERIRNTIRYLRYLIESLVCSGYIDIVCNKATIPHFTKDKLARVPFLLSDEAGEIADYLDVKISQIDDLISTKERIIDNLESYKKSLIYECVTGKKEVV